MYADFVPVPEKEGEDGEGMVPEAPTVMANGMNGDKAT